MADYLFGFCEKTDNYMSPIPPRSRGFFACTECKLQMLFWNGSEYESVKDELNNSNVWNNVTIFGIYLLSLPQKQEG